ncbi:MAG: LacI family DNA-binding transcriptional regulator [Fimbriimonadaceae bacterium]|nr:LacI family DNA-binding transcriptional regulator [Fimbriimonadaceae bacterium]
MATTIKDIARELNISVSTVSYALNGGPRPVPPTVRDRVLQVARELNYRPNRVARSMITRRANAIGVVPMGGTHNVFLSPYLQQALSGIANSANDLHQDLVIFTRFSASDAEAMACYLADGRVDGAVLIAPRLDDDSLGKLRATGIPCVCVSSVHHEGMPTFTTDNAMGIQQVMSYLYGLGHRSFFHLAGPLDMDDARLRLEAYQRFVRSVGLPDQAGDFEASDFTMIGGETVARDLLARSDRPTALVCANDEMAVGALRAASELGVAVPEQLSVTGFDMTPIGAAVATPITTVYQPVVEIAEAATVALLAMIEGGPVAPDKVFPTELVVRSSTSRPQEDV